MEKGTAAFLLENLLDRIEQDPTSGKWRLGTISAKEKTALELLLRSLIEKQEDVPAAGKRPVGEPPAPRVLPTPVTPTSSVELNLQALERTEPESTDTMLCLDFGTAMSKAFAMLRGEYPIELALGKRAGSTGYPVDSSLFVSDEGLIYLGPQAVDMGMQAAEAGRARFDSPKTRLSMGAQGKIFAIPVERNVNPTDTPLTEGELITLYLGYLTDLAVSELEARGQSRYCKRRFARPCWGEDRNRWAEPLLRRMLAQAQILADTFHDRWQAGIPVSDAKDALSKLQALTHLPE